MYRQDVDAEGQRRGHGRPIGLETSSCEQICKEWHRARSARVGNFEQKNVEELTKDELECRDNGDNVGHFVRDSKDLRMLGRNKSHQP
jgi:hypothetical protein